MPPYLWAAERANWWSSSVDGAAHRAQGVVAVGHDIGQREALHAGSPGRLYDAHVGDVVAGHGVELHAQVGHVTAGCWGLQNGPGNGAAARISLADAGGGAVLQRTVHKIHALGVQFHRGYSLRFRFRKAACMHTADAINSSYTIPALVGVVNADFYAVPGKTPTSLIK